MAVEIAAMTDKSDAASVLWLWIAHNRVSLHGLLVGVTKRDAALFQSCGYTMLATEYDYLVPIINNWSSWLSGMYLG